MTRGAHSQLSTTVYRKQTHTDRYLSYDSHQPVEHKTAVVRFLMERASNLSSSSSERMIETQQVIKTLENNNYSKRFILRSATNPKRRSPRDTTLKKLSGFTATPYIGGVSEPLILNQHNIQVALMPYKTIGSMFPKQKTQFLPKKPDGSSIIFPAKNVQISKTGYSQGCDLQG